MKIKIFIIVLIHCFLNKGICTYAQKQVGIEVTYCEKIKIDSGRYASMPKEIREQVYSTVGKIVEGKLLHYENISTYSTNFVNSESIVTKTYGENEEKIIKSTQGSSIFWYKDFKENFYYSKASIMEDKFIIKQSLLFNWEILNEFENIDSFYTQKAVATLEDGIKVIAWFTEKITINDGPQIYAGLPGLILKVELPKKVIYATKIKYLEAPINFGQIPQGGKVVSQSEFNLAVKNKFDKKNNKTTTETIGNIIKTNSTIIY